MEIFADKERYVIYRNPDSFFGYCGWPSVCIDDEGVLYAACSGLRLGHVCPFGKTLLFKSFDGGRTWSVPMLVNDTWLDDRDTGLLYLGGKTILLTWFTHPTEKYLSWRGHLGSGCQSILDLYPSVPEGQNKGGSFVRVSRDGGFSWGKTVQVPVSSPHGPALLKDGRILYLGKEMYAEDGLTKDCVAAYESRDCGETWTKVCELSKPEGDPWVLYDEPHALELENGRILGGIRWEGPGDAPHPCIHLTHSDDGGKTWSPMLPTDIPATSHTPPHLIRHSSGALILTFGRRAKPFGERAAVSYDNGETWEDEYILRQDPDGNTGDLGYAATTELKDGSLLSVYYQAYEGDPVPSLLCTKWRRK